MLVFVEIDNHADVKRRTDVWEIGLILWEQTRNDSS